MNKILALLLVLSVTQCSSQISQTHILITYVPFSTKFNIRVSEKDLSNMNSSKSLIVKRDTISIDSINELIGYQLEILKKSHGLTIPYDLRMGCIYEHEEKRIEFYFDNKGNTIFSGQVFKNQKLLDIIFSNICRPYYSLIIEEEKKYWPTDQKKCEDSLEFINDYSHFK